MKTTFLTFVILLFAITGSFSQEEQKVKKNEFRLDLLEFFGSTFRMEYERELCEKSSLNIVFAPTALDNNQKEMYGIYAQVNPKFYYIAGKSKGVEHSLYFSPFASYRYFDISESYSEYQYPLGYNNPGVFIPIENNFIANSAMAGTLFGYKILCGDFFVLNIECGGGIRYVFNKAGNCSYAQVNQGFNNWNLGYSGIFPKFNLTMGFKF